MRSIGNIEELLEKTCAENGWEWRVKLETGTECAWAGEVQITLNPNTHGVPDRSVVAYKTGGAHPTEVFKSAAEAALTFALETSF